jgi:hypothetical protein
MTALHSESEAQVSSPHWHLNMRTMRPFAESSIVLTSWGRVPQRLHLRPSIVILPASFVVLKWFVVNMTEHRCLTEQTNSRNSFQADFAAHGNGFVGTRGRLNRTRGAAEPGVSADRPDLTAVESPDLPAALLESGRGIESAGSDPRPFPILRDDDALAALPLSVESRSSKIRLLGRWAGLPGGAAAFTADGTSIDRA